MTQGFAQAVAGRWQARLDEPGYLTAYDVHRDGVIKVADIALVTAAWGDRCW